MSFPPVQGSEPTSRGGISERIVAISTAWRTLVRQLSRWRELLEFGPISGAYYPIVFHRHIPAGLSAIAIAHRVFSASQMRVIEVSAWVNTGQLTFRVHTEAGQVLGSTVVTSAGTMITATASFNLQEVASGQSLWIEIVSINSGTPAELTVKVTAKQLSKIEPA